MPERDMVARSVGESRVLVGEAKRSLDRNRAARLLAGLADADLPGVRERDIVPVLFVQRANELPRQTELGFVMDAESVLSALQ